MYLRDYRRKSEEIQSMDNYCKCEIEKTREFVITNANACPNCQKQLVSDDLFPIEPTYDEVGREEPPLQTEGVTMRDRVRLRRQRPLSSDNESYGLPDHTRQENRPSLLNDAQFGSSPRTRKIPSMSLSRFTVKRQ